MIFNLSLQLQVGTGIPNFIKASFIDALIFNPMSKSMHDMHGNI